jgi:complement component 1 Q subcomponent-binding protein, mitochondrial
MFSLRAFARRAPRPASQIANYTTRISRPSIQSFIKPSSILSLRPQPFKAAFSTSPSRFDEAGIELATKLQSEINIEAENNDTNTDSDGNVKQFFDNNSFWSVEDIEGEQDVTITRQYDDETIVRTSQP